jgi:hypothetical protein
MPECSRGQGCCSCSHKRMIHMLSTHSSEIDPWHGMINMHP